MKFLRTNCHLMLLSATIGALDRKIRLLRHFSCISKDIFTINPLEKKQKRGRKSCFSCFLRQRRANISKQRVK